MAMIGGGEVSKIIFYITIKQQTFITKVLKVLFISAKIHNPIIFNESHGGFDVENYFFILLQVKKYSELTEPFS